MDNIVFSIVDQCNLRCPSCVAEHTSISGTLRYSSLELCDKVFERTKTYYGKTRIALYSLCEPLLHPHIVELLDIAQKHGLQCEISTNLNVKKDFAPILRHPALIRFDITISGIQQEVYASGHRGGNIGLVLKNMETISHLEGKNKVHVKYLLYNDNIEDKTLAEELCMHYGFKFATFNAIYFPYGAMINSIVNNNKLVHSPDIKNLLKRLTPPSLWEIMSIKGFESSSCHAQTNRLLLNYKADIFTCNYATYGTKGYLANFLELTKEEVYARKQDADFCVGCKKHGLHVQLSLKSTFTTSAELNAFHSILHDKPFNLTAKKIFIYGYGLLGKELYNFFNIKKINILGFIDDNPSLHGEIFKNTPVKALSDYDEDMLYGAYIVLGTSPSMQSKKEQFDNIYKRYGSKVMTFGSFLVAMQNNDSTV